MNPERYIVKSLPRLRRKWYGLPDRDDLLVSQRPRCTAKAFGAGRGAAVTFIWREPGLHLYRSADSPVPCNGRVAQTNRSADSHVREKRMATKWIGFPRDSRHADSAVRAPFRLGNTP